MKNFTNTGESCIIYRKESVNNIVLVNDVIYTNRRKTKQK